MKLALDKKENGDGANIVHHAAKKKKKWLKSVILTQREKHTCVTREQKIIHLIDSGLMAPYHDDGNSTENEI